MPDLSKPDGTLTKTDHNKSEVLNDFFSSVFTIEHTANIPTFDTCSSSLISFIEVTEKQIHDKLATLNLSKSAGPDGMHPIILRELSDVLAAPLKKLFDNTLKEGKIPQSWKRAEVKPIFKKGDKNNPGNYRPV